MNDEMIREIDEVAKEAKKGNVFVGGNPNFINLSKIGVEIFKLFMKGRKSGWKTTEFWLSAITVVGTTILTFTGKLSAEWCVSVSTGATALYVLARTYVKHTETEVDDKILDAIVKSVLEPIGVSVKEVE
jgi:hypothetical protein